MREGVGMKIPLSREERARRTLARFDEERRAKAQGWNSVKYWKLERSADDAGDFETIQCAQAADAGDPEAVRACDALLRAQARVSAWYAKKGVD